MNFIAHLYLSGTNEGLLIGNFIADSIKGKNLDIYPAHIRQGILFHRFIDMYTDSHVLVKHSKSLFQNKYRHYAGVLVDIFYDHIFTRNWNVFSSISLSQFAANVYRVLAARREEYPKEMQLFLDYIIADDKINGYKDLSVIQQVLDGMSKRTSFESSMEKALTDLEKNYASLEQDFILFFPQLEAACKNYLAEQGQN